ncbi:FAD/NAD(P)-binding domain-containing protein, partial [Punctularia strigosozonata HHB-11173 SS5]|uniref:FAD/NAD(P)-binding domain-containing protein n=1 Tax=Punctularia strigosozonata (strain HHB-11173) TaxID=741275 RepID=UPI000441835A
FTLNVCYSGGGIGGLTFALALARSNADVELDIYEGASQLTATGAGIIMWRRVWQVIEALGLSDELGSLQARKPSSDPQTSYRLRRCDLDVGVNFHDLVTPGGLILVHRGDFQHILLRHLPEKYRIHVGKRLLGYTESVEEVELQFEDGSTTTCDLLVGADGVKSATRASLTASGGPVWSGWCAYRGLIPADVCNATLSDHPALNGPMLYCAKNKHVIAYPLRNASQTLTALNVVGLISEPVDKDAAYSGPWVAEVDKDHMEKNFGDLEDEVQRLFKCFDRPIRWAIHVTKPLDSYISDTGRVALIGDAAHAMTPFQGSGAGQAIEDAYLLAQVLVRSGLNGADLKAVLKAYDSLRRPASQEVVRRSELNGLLYELRAPGWVDIAASDTERMRELGATIERNWEWAWTTKLDDDIDAAMDYVFGSISRQS